MHDNSSGTCGTVIMHGYISHNLGTAVDGYIIADHGISVLGISDGDLLIDPAVFSYLMGTDNGRESMLDIQTAADNFCIQIQGVQRTPKDSADAVV